MATGTIENKIAFGSNLVQKQTTYTNIDTLIDSECKGSESNVYMFDNRGTMFGAGNRHLILAWFNTAANYGFALCLSYMGMYFVRRSNSTTSTITVIAS